MKLNMVLTQGRLKIIPWSKIVLIIHELKKKYANYDFANVYLTVFHVKIFEDMFVKNLYSEAQNQDDNSFHI